jgi:predicted small lipoprotein YifL
MKKLLSFLMVIAVVNLMLTSCNLKQEDPPVLPPYESMVIDFSDFNNDAKADDLAGKSADETMVNFAWAGWNVLVFNVILTVTLVVPVATFATAVNQTSPVFLGDATWQWSFTVDGFGGAYTARLTGEVRAEDAYWEMYVSKTGFGAFDEFMWYSGTSKLDGTGGQWILNHSHNFQEPMLQIDWESDGEEVGEIQYTIVRELNDARQPEPANGSYILAGRNTDELDAFYDIYLAETPKYVFIEWSTETYNGRIMDEVFFGDDDWHCWDTNGYDVVCGM